MQFAISTQWKVCTRASQEHFAQFSGVSPLIVQILYNRNIQHVTEVTEFLDGKASLHDPFLMKGMTSAVQHIQHAITNKETIVVYGDYDVDGVTSTVLTVQVLQALGADVKPYIPNRFEEGYGLNKEAIAELAQRGTNLIITVDCGIRSHDEIAYGNSLGMKFIVTDHHTLAKDTMGHDIVPPALTVLNPKQADCEYPFEELCGVGICFKLTQALLSECESVTDLQEEDVIDLVALGTVADIVPLLGENRTLVKKGLAYINKQPKRLGLQAMIEQTGSELGRIGSDTIGFVFGPRLNAAGRLKHARFAYALLFTKDKEKAKKLALALNQINVERQAMTRQFVEMARNEVLAGEELAPLYLICRPEFSKGVVGLVSSRLTEEFYRPTLVAQQDETHTTGSARSIPEFHITQALDQCADLLERYGGHATAAGFTIENSKLPDLRNRLVELARESFGGEPLQKTLLIDAEVNLRGVSYQLVDEINGLNPFGHKNQSPLFLTRNLVVQDKRTVGKNNTHLKLRLFDGKRSWDAIGFRLANHETALANPDKIDVVYSLEFNTWNDLTRIQLNLRDIKPSVVD
ncbi:MAG: single-stranded-DNA-specific exonuclease RecJ [Anaerolineaceae bacterium 4572_78]|nr:MAG: single-stranded-DNA-specific exonuclease RecJ [Anaerolineaceae bacterium 4572_78]